MPVLFLLEKWMSRQKDTIDIGIHEETDRHTQIRQKLSTLVPGDDYGFEKQNDVRNLYYMAVKKKTNFTKWS